MAEERYFVLMGESQVGPLGIQQVRNMRSAGTIHDETLLWREGDPEWLPCTAFAAVLPDEVTEITSAPVPEPEPVPVPVPVPDFAEPEPIPAAPSPELETSQSADPAAPRITPSSIWREIEADRQGQPVEPSVERIGSSLDDPTTDDPTVPGACPSCGAEIQYCPVCGRPLREHPV